MEPIPSFSPSQSLVRQRTIVPAQAQRDRLVEIASEIARHQTQIARLEQEGSALEDSLSRVIYPVLTLPNEITARIFVHCLPNHGERPSPQAAPLLPAQICRHWRAVALATCELWSRLYIRWPYNADGTATAASVKTWISRAKGHPLSLGLDPNRRQIPSELLEFISSRCGQIRRLEICLDLAQFHQLCPPQTPLPLLQHFAIRRFLDEDPQAFLESAPSLCELRLIDAPKITFRLPSLTNLEISNNISLEIFLHILRHTPHLAEFGCAAETAIPSTHDPHVPETFASLSRLALRWSELFLNFVIFPSLCRLELHDNWYHEELDCLEVVMSFVSRSACVISHLVLGLEGCDEEEFADWLEAFPSVKSLDIQNGPDLDRLIPCLSAASVLPELRELDISSLQPNVDYNVLIEMLQQRRDPMNAVKLQSFRLNLFDFQEEDEPSYPWPPPDLAAWELKRMMANGLRFVLNLSFGIGTGEFWPDPSISKNSGDRFNTSGGYWYFDP
ncbi:hypothetical protein C8R45DRAFT_543796 [Mycena sanguinolenta]|nr:hypothetical protein C8R45DRAFT_543796 [Mycena sanguinolenta]